MSTQVFAVILSVFPAQTSYLQETQYPEFAPLKIVCPGICSNTLVSFHTHLTCKKLSGLNLHHSNNQIVRIDILLKNAQIIILSLCSNSSSNYTTSIWYDFFFVCMTPVSQSCIKFFPIQDKPYSNPVYCFPVCEFHCILPKLLVLSGLYKKYTFYIALLYGYTNSYFTSTYQYKM